MREELKRLFEVGEELMEYWDEGNPVHPGATVVSDFREAMLAARKTLRNTISYTPYSTPDPKTAVVGRRVPGTGGPHDAVDLLFASEFDLSKTSRCFGEWGPKKGGR